MRKNVNPLVIAARLDTGDAVKALIAAPGAGFRLRIFSIAWSVRTAAAQVIDVGVAAGTAAQQFLSIPASSAGYGQIVCPPGFVLPANTALSADPAAAGPAVQFIVEYIVEQAPVS